MRSCRAIVAASLGGLLVLPVGGLPAAASAPGWRPAAAAWAGPGQSAAPARAAAARVDGAVTVLGSGRLRVHVRTSSARVIVTYVVRGRSTRSMSLPVRRGAARVTLPPAATSVKVRGAASAGRRATPWKRLVIPPRSPWDVAPSAAEVAALELQLLELVNQVRATGMTCPDGRVMAPVAPLARDGALESAARVHAAWQAGTGIMSHTGAGGSTVGVRISAAGFPWSRAAEVVAAGQQEPAATLQQWLGSARHCHALLDPDVTGTGIAYAYSHHSLYRHFWTQDLARP